MSRSNTDLLFDRDVGQQWLRQALEDEQAGFRPSQWEAIEAVVQHRRRCLVVQRTGWGKSLVYFLATLFHRKAGQGFTLLVSPLLALMRNQIQQAERLGLVAMTVNSDNTEDWERVFKEILSDQVDVLLISPERLANADFVSEVLDRVLDRVGLLVIDEAHCISDWGHDFRPDYRRLRSILGALPARTPALLTTATANERVMADLLSVVGDELDIQRGPMVRHSLRLQVEPRASRAERFAKVYAALETIPGSGIVYVLTRRDAIGLSAWLESEGVASAVYMGARSGEERERNLQVEDDLLANRLKVVVATTALGMGYDKPDLSFVIHFQMPGSVVGYYQQVGRAGRAIPQAYGILLPGEEDEEIQDYFIREAFPPVSVVDAILRILEEHPRGLKLGDFDGCLNLPPGKLKKILKILEVMEPAPVYCEDWRYYRAPGRPPFDHEIVTRLEEIRTKEWERMQAFAETDDCRMAFLCEELDSPLDGPCGGCDNCKEPLILEPSRKIRRSAGGWGQRLGVSFAARVKWPRGAQAELEELGLWNGSSEIDASMRCESGMFLAYWGDKGTGAEVREGKSRGEFSDQFIRTAAKILREKGLLDRVEAVACIPSSRHQRLVPKLASSLAGLLRIPFLPEALRVARVGEPQKTMVNSVHQVRNVAGAFEVEVPDDHHGKSLLLVDDCVDSRWTFTVAGAQLRAAGAGEVVPFALASTNHSL